MPCLWIIAEKPERHDPLKHANLWAHLQPGDSAKYVTDTGTVRVRVGDFGTLAEGVVVLNPANRDDAHCGLSLVAALGRATSVQVWYHRGENLNYWDFELADLRAQWPWIPDSWEMWPITRAARAPWLSALQNARLAVRRSPFDLRDCGRWFEEARKSACREYAKLATARIGTEMLRITSGVLGAVLPPSDVEHIAAECRRWRTLYAQLAPVCDVLNDLTEALQARQVDANELVALVR